MTSTGADNPDDRPQDAQSSPPAGSAPPPVPSYDPPQGGFAAAPPPPPPAGYEQGGYPQQGGYQQGGYPQQGGYQQGGYQQGGYPQEGGYNYPQPAYGAGAPLTDSDQRLWSVLSHIGGVFVSFLVPLVVWLVFKGRGGFVEDQSREALNFQITLVIAYVVGTVLVIVGIGILILIAAWVLSIVFAILAAVKSSQGELYRYPLSIRFIS